MIFTRTSLPGAFLVDLDRKCDDRGFFARVFCRDEFQRQDLKTELVQIHDSHNAERGTLRGMHYQLSPHAEAKLVRCIRGSVHDVILDLRPQSPTFGVSFGAVLTAENRTMMYVPEGCAHGFITLESATDLMYFVTGSYSRDRERGLRWNDPRFKIRWPIEPTVLSERDRNHPEFDPEWHLT